MQVASRSHIDVQQMGRENEG